MLPAELALAGPHAALLRSLLAAGKTAPPLLVAIVNVTPDSFSDGGQLLTLDDIVARGLQCVAQGADLLDVGGESTRPGAAEVSEQEELRRVVPAIQALVACQALPVWVDTRRASVAEAALQAGASGVNDVSGFGDPAMASVVQQAGVPWVLMHMPHKVGAMQASAAVVAMPKAAAEGVMAVAAGLAATVQRAVQSGVRPEQLLLDPGIGFGKSVEQNLALCQVLGPLQALGLPVYVGPSRKSFVRAVSRPGTAELPTERVWGTAAAVTATVLAGASVVRVHDVAAMRQVVDVAWAIRQAALLCVQS